jgi:hypothetical protein
MASWLALKSWVMFLRKWRLTGKTGQRSHRGRLPMACETPRDDVHPNSLAGALEMLFPDPQSSPPARMYIHDVPGYGYIIEKRDSGSRNSYIRTYLFFLMPFTTTFYLLLPIPPFLSQLSPFWRACLRVTLSLSNADIPSVGVRSVMW